jgi:hypothetical protein
VRLAGFERRWLLAVFAAILPSGAHDRLSLGAADLPLSGFVDDLFRAAPLETRLGVRAALWVVMLIGPLVLGRLGLFTGLSPDEQAEALARLGRSDLYALREIPSLLKMMACLAYGAFPGVRAQIGLPYPDEGPPGWARAGERG